MKKNDLREKIHLTSVDELFGLENAESSIEIGIDRIRSFKDYPFKVIDDDKMADMVESIKANGVLTPVVVRGNDGDGYEMISGHRRLHASKLVGLKKIPAFVRELSDDEATIVMVDSNIQREELLPSEKENIDQEKMIMILHNALPSRTSAKKVVMNEKKLRKYFPEEYTSGQMERVIEALLEQWSREQKGVADGI